MIKSKIKYAIILIAVIFLSISMTAQVFATDTDVTYESEEIDVYDSDLFVLYGEDDDEDTYVMSYYINGNAFIIGNKVEITGQINGSLYVIANELTISEDAYIACDIYAIADILTINGTVYDVYAVADNFTTGESALIYRDVKVLADSLYLRGVIGRNLLTEAAKIDVYDEDSELYVGGNIDYSAYSEIEDIDKIDVEGEITFTLIEDEEQTTSEVISSYIYNGIKNILYTLIIYLVIMFLAPKFIQKSREYLSTKSFASAGIGICFIILVPIIALCVFMLTSSFSAVALLLMIYAIVLMISNAMINMMITEFVANKYESINSLAKKILVFIVTAIAVFILKNLPYIGTLISIIVVLVGTGMPIMYQFDKRKQD